MSEKTKSIFNKLIWAVIYIIIVLNIYLLYQLRKNSIDIPPFDDLNIHKPTLILLLDEFECPDCVKNLLFLNELYDQLKDGGQIDFLGIILSRTKNDSKNIAKVFDFPVMVTDNFKIFKRLNMNQTPLIVGLSHDRRIVYSELIPFETALDEDYFRRGIIDRLYYSLYQ